MLATGINPPPILRLDVAGYPVAWIPWQEAVCLYVKGQVAWEVGQESIRISGGISRISGERSFITVNSIVAVQGIASHLFKATVPHLTNRELFRRDGGICMYCGGQFSDRELTRDHITPKSRGGSDQWTNVVAACKRCNTHKGARTPEEAGMPLLAIPFVPNSAEYLALKNRRILADQMEFLKKQFRHERLIEMV
ncbi:MAG: HNH endonuclease [Gammaproteobacteria bacterium]|nr:HNH endonuclease [Gammaproteobacteria bacterium]MDH5691919.1 HNH endonuclease [Gammaproteobacteria bacterium]